VILDRFKSAIADVIEAMVGSRLDYLARYPARVVAQNGNRVDLKPDDQRVPGVAGVPISVGIPGTTVEVVPGARVLLAFEGGDPTKPIAEIWEHGTPFVLAFDAMTEVVIDAPQVKLGKNAVFGVARAGVDTAGPYIITAGSPKVRSE